MLAGSLVALPLTVGVLLLLAGRRADRPAAASGIAVAVAVLVLAVTAALTRPAADVGFLAGIRLGLAVDALSAVMVVAVAVVSLAVLVFAAGESGLRTARFTGGMLLFSGAMLVTVTATTLLGLLMAWEVMGAASWALIGHRWRQARRVRAGQVAFLTTRSADLGLYVAAGAALAGGTGSLALAELPGTAEPWLHVVAAGVVLAALGKSAQLPFSFWLSRAMEGPSPVSALLHSATLVAAGAYLLLRLAPLTAAAGWAAGAVAWAGAGTALLLGLVAVAQTDLKQLLAASTCAQIGFMVLAAGVGGVGAGAAQLVAHAATKSLLFLAAGAWLVALGTKQLTGLRGAARRYPLVGVTFTVGAASLAGLPPLSLWFTKDAVLAAALEHGSALYVTGLVAAAVSAVYSATALWWVWQPLPARVPTPEPGPEPAGRVSPAMWSPLIVLAVLAATLGALPLLPGGPVTADPAPAGWELLLSAVVATVAVGLTWRLAPVRRPRALAGWLGLERAAGAVVVAPTLALSRALARFDEAVLDRAITASARSVRRLARAVAVADDAGLGRAVEGSARATVAVADALSRRGEVSVARVVAAVAGGARVLGRLARRPQTGQIHQYYAQAAAVLALLALLLVVVR